MASASPNDVHCLAEAYDLIRRWRYAADERAHTTETVVAGSTIHVSSEFKDCSVLFDPLQEYSPNNALLHAVAVKHGASVGLTYMGNHRTNLDACVMYGVAPIGQEDECIRRMVDAIRAKHGPGQWWTAGEAVHVVGEPQPSTKDFLVVHLQTIGGLPHAMLRSVYYFDGAPCNRP